MPKPQILVDGDPVSHVRSQLVGALEERFKTSTDGQHMSFVGLVWSDSDPVLFLPKGLNRDEIEWKKNSRLICSCLRKYAKQINNSGEPDSGEYETDYPVALKLLENYLENGLFNNTEKLHQYGNSGKVNWSRTIKQVQPYISQGGAPVYLSQIVSKQSITTNIVHEIHKALIHESDQQFGWLLSETKDSVAPDCFNSKLSVPRTTAISLIKREMNNHFSDRKIIQLKLMESYLLEKNARKKNSSQFFGTTGFQHVWEKMCAVYLGDQKEDNPIPAVPVYLFGKDSQSRKENGPRPDVVVRDGKRLAVIDAKYYDFSRSVPSWPDLVKQFFYAKAYKSNPDLSSVRNFLALPRIESKKPDRVVIEDNHGNQLDNEFEPVQMLFLETLEVMRYFVNHQVSKPMRANVLR
jgi:hypothetical protein